MKLNRMQSVLSSSDDEEMANITVGSICKDDHEEEVKEKVNEDDEISNNAKEQNGSKNPKSPKTQESNDDDNGKSNDSDVEMKDDSPTTVKLGSKDNKKREVNKAMVISESDGEGEQNKKKVKTEVTEKKAPELRVS